MYFEFESTQPESQTNQTHNNHVIESRLRPRHRRMSSSSQSLRELIDEQNVIENIEPFHCDLYLITRKKLSQISTNTIKSNHDLRREVLLTSIHRNFSAKTVNSNSNSCQQLFDDMIRDKSQLNISQTSSRDCDQEFKNGSLSTTTSTCTTTMANSIGGTRMTTTSKTQSTPSSHKKRNLSSPTSTSIPNSGNEEEWKTTIKRLKVVHGIDCSFDVSMDSDFEGICDNDLNDLTNNFHRLKTPFS